VNLEDEGIFLRAIEIRRLDDPALDFALVEGGFVPELLDGAQFLEGEELAIERGEDAEFRVGKRSDRDVAGIGGRVVAECECAAAGDAELRAGIEMIGQNARRTFERKIREFGIALIRVGEEDALAVGGPAGIGRVDRAGK